MGKKDFQKSGVGITAKSYGKDKIGFISHTIHQEKFHMDMRSNYKKWNNMSTQWIYGYILFSLGARKTFRAMTQNSKIKKEK